MSVDLTSAYLKLQRAKEHVNDLRRRIEEMRSGGDFITLHRQYEPKEGSIIFRVANVIAVPDEWALVVGDAVHNFRCSLDHLAWQLAIRHFGGVEPTDRKAIRNIQFPVMSDVNDWNSSRFSKHFDTADWNKLKQFQPFFARPYAPASSLNPLEEFCGFHGVSNVDKHRRIQLTCVSPEQGHYYVPSLDEFKDCRPITSGDGILAISTSPMTPKPGDEILRVPVTVTGPNPDADFKARLTAYIAIRETWKLPDNLERLGEWVEGILRSF